MPNLKNKKVIKDQQGQRKYPGRVTEIQGNTMATTGYGDIPLYVVPNVGNPMVVPANSGNRVFPGASSFTEYPIAKNGGWLEKYQVGGKTLEDNDSWLENIAEIVDPTGLSSWDDVYRAYKNSGLSKETALESFGAIPLLGKISKVTKPGIHLTKYSGLDKILKNTLPRNKSLSRAANVSSKIGRGTDAVQAVVGSKDDSGFTWDLRHGEVPKYDGRNIFPQIDLGEHGDYAYGGWLEKYGDGGKKLDTSNWEQSSLDSLKLFNNSQNLKNLIKNSGNYNNSFETSKPVKRTSTGNFKIPNPNNPIEYKKILDDFGYNIISDKGFPDIKLYQNKNIQPTQTLTYTRKESKYKTEKEYNEAAKKIKSFNETPGEASWIGYSIQTYQKPVGVQKKVETIKEPVKTETINLTEPVKTQVVNTPNPIDKDRREVNFGQKYQTFNYPGQHGYSGNDVTSKYFDPTTKNEIDVSKSFDLKGNYNPVYLEQKKYGGWLDTYEDGGETDPPVNLRSASTQLASAVSTQAPEVPLNKTGWDWVKQKYENRQPSDWNMLMMDKSGSYVDSGVDPFSLMLTAPQQVIKAGVKGGKALLDASKSNKIKQVIHQNELRDIENLKKSFKEAQELKNKDVNTVEIYKNIKSGENWKYPNINITKEQYNSAKNNLKIGPYTAISFAKNNPDKIIIPSKSDNLFKNTPSGNTFYQFYGEGPMSNHTIYTPDIHDYINKYHPYTTSRANLESIDLARKDGLKDVSKYFKENFKDYKIPINDFISLPQNKYGGIVKTSQNKQDNSQWLDKYK